MRKPLRRVLRALPSLPATFVWFAAVACLVIMPAVVGSLRTSEYKASIPLDVFTNHRRLEDRVDHVRAVVTSPGIAAAIAEQTPNLIHPDSVPERIRVSSEAGVATLTATGETPSDAHDLATAAGTVLKSASRREIYPIGRAGVPAPQSLVDRLLAPLPGPFPARPHPIFSAAVGFVLALLLYVGWRRRFESSGDSAAALPKN